MQCFLPSSPSLLSFTTRHSSLFLSVVTIPAYPVVSAQENKLTAQAVRNLLRVLDEIRNRPILTAADSAGAARQGVVLNMAVAQNRVTFEASQAAARSSRLNLSSKPLRLATEVSQ